MAGWIARAERPLIITAGPGIDDSAVAALARVAERAAIPVCCHNPRSLPLPSSHPMHAGFDSGPLVGEGAACIFEETGELIGCEHIMAARAITPALGQELEASVAKAARYYATLGYGSFAAAKFRSA